MKTEILPERLAELSAILAEKGPTRILINESGEAVAPDKIGNEHIPTIIFIREDGWSVGAAAHLELAAFSLWKDDWVAFEDLEGEDGVQSIKEYVG